MSKLNIKKIDSLLEKLLLNRLDRLDRFDANYIEDFSHIIKEEYNINSLEDLNENEVLFSLKEELQLKSSDNIEQLTKSLLSIDAVDKDKFGPKIATKETKQRHKYDKTKIWSKVENVKLNNTNAEDLNELQIQYSLNSGGNAKRGADFHKFFSRNGTNFGTVKTKLFEDLKSIGTLKKDSSLLTIGPRWDGEVILYRDVLGFKNTIGLDLFSKNENLIKIGDMHEMPFEDNTFDFVHQRNTFNKSYDLRKALDECVRVLKNGGVIVSDDCLNYTIGVTEIARSNMTSNKWITKYLGERVERVILDHEEFTKEYFIEKVGLYAVKIVK